MEIKRYRIYSRKEQKYIVIGSKLKTSWGSFPKLAIEEEKKWNKDFKKFDEFYEVHEFHLELAKRLTESKKEVIF